MEEEFWNIKTDDERPAETLRTFIIFCEDQHHEPLYFKSFEQQKSGIKINAIPNVKSKKLNLNNTIEICKNDGLIAFLDGKYSVLPEVVEQLWCVYDRDMESTDWNAIPAHNHIDFDTAISTANNIGLNVAWSNDVFEMWILLHFETIPTENILHRNYVYDRLTYIFKNNVQADQDLAALIALPTFNYKDNMKRRDRFITQVIPLLHSLTNQAIANANILEATFTSVIPYHRRNPCTMVHKLVQEIII